MRAPFRPLNSLARPGRVIATAFAATILFGTLLLLLPGATQRGHHATVVEALFTATSAICVTGHVVVDTGRSGRRSDRPSSSRSSRSVASA